MNKEDVKIGAIIKHKYRKTAYYMISDIRSNSFVMARCDKDGTPRPQRTKYVIKNSDLPLITLIKAGTGAVAAAPASKQVVRVTRVAAASIQDLRNLADKSFGLISKNIVAEFESLESQLSPENLTCDGELSPAQIRARKADLLAKWSLLEQYIDTTVVANI